jgi:hypothetical protein
VHRWQISESEETRDYHARASTLAVSRAASRHAALRRVAPRANALASARANSCCVNARDASARSLLIPLFPLLPLHRSSDVAH